MDKSNFFKSINIKHLLKAEIIINISFLSLNIIIIILVFFILRATIEKIKFLKFRLIILCIIKAIMRIISKYTVLLPIINTFQIYLIIRLIETISTDIDSIINNQNVQNDQNDQINQYNDKIYQYFIIASLIINLPYERFSSFKIFICLLQNITLILYSILFYKYVNKKINIIIIKLIDSKLIKCDDAYIRLLNVQLPILLLLLFIFIIDILVGFLGDSTIVLYSKLVKMAIKESANVLIFLVLYSMIYLLEKINQKKIVISNSSSSTETKKLMNEQ